MVKYLIAFLFSKKKIISIHFESWTWEQEIFKTTRAEFVVKQRPPSMLCHKRDVIKIDNLGRVQCRASNR